MVAAPTEGKRDYRRCVWPLNVADVAAAIAPDATPLGAPAGMVERAFAWKGAPARKGDLFFAVERAIEDDLAAALARGAWCVVSRTWSGLATLSAAQRDLVFVAAKPLAAFRRLAAALRLRFPFPVVAVGGSNGKTTTKDLVATVLGHGGRSVTSTPGTNNGWVGTPITLCHPDHRAPAPSALVLEIGIDEKDAMRAHVAIAQPDIAVITALGPEHLAGLGSHEEAIREELELFAGAKRRVWLADDPALATRLGDARADDLVVHDAARAVVTAAGTLSYAWRRASETSGVLALARHGRSIDANVPLPGAHNGRNAALAVGVGLLLGRDLDDCAAALETFTAPAQRCNVRRLPSGCIVIDDTYNASPASVVAALDVLDAFDPARTRVVVLGDMLDLGSATDAEHAALAPRLRRSIAGAHVRLVGDAMKTLAPALADVVASVDASDALDIALDAIALDDAVVLVKASRGMRLERVVDRVIERGRDVRPPGSVAVGVAGEGADALARTLRTELAGRNVVVRALTVEDLEGARAATMPFDVGILGRFVPAGGDPERQLAAIAQLFVHLTRGGVAVVGGGDEAAELIAGIVPDHVTRLDAPRPEEIVRVACEAVVHRCDRSV